MDSGSPTQGTVHWLMAHSDPAPTKLTSPSSSESSATAQVATETEENEGDQEAASVYHLMQKFIQQSQSCTTTKSMYSPTTTLPFRGSPVLLYSLNTVICYSSTKL